MNKRTGRIISWSAAIALAAVSSSALPPGEDNQPIRISDPWLLESMGYPPDATNIYATPHAYAELYMSPDEAASRERALGNEETADLELRSFGSDTGVSTVHASDFTSASSAADFQVGLEGSQLWCNSGSSFFHGVFRDLPHGARATVRRVWYYDNDAIQNIAVWLQRTCIPFHAAGEPTTTILASNTSSGTPGYGRFGPGSFLLEDIDNNSCVYYIRARLGNGGSCVAGGDLRLLKATLSWRRQVSPPPGDATFGDVPTTHPFFPFVEALVASGITAGCGGGDFCPDEPLTRGQMAVFLSAALGLSWDGPFTP